MPRVVFQPQSEADPILVRFDREVQRFIDRTFSLRAVVHR
jgi:hypothetical protein